MPLPLFLQRLRQGALGHQPGAEPVSLSQADLEVARVRARRRLIGMVVLVGAGVVGFPWLFETQPRPMSSDVVMVQQGASAPVASPVSSKPGVQAKVKSVIKPSPSSDEAKEEFIDEPLKVTDKKPVAEVKPASSSATAKPTMVAKPAPSEAAPQVKAAAPADKAPSAAAVRYIVQIGAYSDATSAHEVRMKAERAGLKTYTQVIGTDANKKIRVRLGPFEDKAAADKAMAGLRKAGLTGGLLTL